MWKSKSKPASKVLFANAVSLLGPIKGASCVRDLIWFMLCVFGSVDCFCYVLSEGPFFMLLFLRRKKEGFAWKAASMVLPGMTCSWQPSVCQSMTALSFQVLVCQASPFFCITQPWPNIATARSVEKSLWLPLNRGSNTQGFNDEASISWTAQNSHHDFSFLTYKDYTDNQEVFWTYLLCY